MLLVHDSKDSSSLAWRWAPQVVRLCFPFLLFSLLSDVCFRLPVARSSPRFPREEKMRLLKDEASSYMPGSLAKFRETA